MPLPQLSSSAVSQQSGSLPLATQTTTMVASFT